MNKYVHACLLLVFVLAVQCSSKTQVNENDEQADETQSTDATSSVFAQAAQSVFSITTYDGERILESGQGFLVTSNTLIAPFSLFREATRAEITPLNGGVITEVSKFFNFDRINNVILLEVIGIEAEPLRIYGGQRTDGIKTVTVSRRRGNIQPIQNGTCLQEQYLEGRKLYSISNNVGINQQGTPVLVSNGSVLGMGVSQQVVFQRRSFAVPGTDFIPMINSRGQAKPLSEMGKADTERNSAIKHIVLKTTYGDIKIKLFNETPTYRDNFIQLAEEGFYDSLLIHRVIRDFGIQTGAADTRHSHPDDVVGWKGPGYTLPAHIVEGFFHKRGAIGSPRKPDDINHNRRSDGSQFYIVTGRTYTDEELDALEKEHRIEYTEHQRQVYKTVGGSPHIDQAYTVFGEVISGLDVADRMTLMPVKGNFRPLQDIRLLKVEVVY